MDGGFFLIIANFRDDKLGEVEKRLEKLNVERINVCRVRASANTTITSHRTG